MSVFINDGGVEKEAKMIYVNDGGIDKLVAGGGVEPDFEQGELWLNIGIDPMPGIKVNAVEEGNGLLVAVGDEGHLSTSNDGINWTPRTSTFGDSNISDVAFGNGLWVAVGALGKLATSTNGVSWTQRTNPHTSEIAGVHYSDGLWVVVGGSARISTSSDGINWTLRNSGGQFTFLRSVFFAGGLWVAAGDDGRLFTSNNGIDWTDHGNNSFAGLTGQRIRKVYFHDGLWVACSNPANSGRIFTSTDGINWTVTPFISGARPNRDVVFSNGIWISVGELATILYSDDATNWDVATVLGFEGSPEFTSVVFVNGSWFVYGRGSVVNLSGYRWN